MYELRITSMILGYPLITIGLILLVRAIILDGLDNWASIMAGGMIFMIGSILLIVAILARIVELHENQSIRAAS